MLWAGENIHLHFPNTNIIPGDKYLERTAEILRDFIIDALAGKFGNRKIQLDLV